MAQLKENSTVTKNAADNTIWHDNYNNISTNGIIPITGLTDNFSELSVNGLILASDAENSDEFGRYLAMSNNRIVVGAAYEDTVGTSAGAVYIFDLDGNELKKIQSSDVAESDFFGKGVACSDTRIVVGAVGDDDKGGSSGSVYIFDINGNELFKLSAYDGLAGDYYGDNGVAISNNRIVVGARGVDINGTTSGAVYVYDIDGNFLRKILAHDGAQDDNFGEIVAVSNNRIVVGVPQKSNWLGTTYIYDIDGILIKQIAQDTPTSNDAFGKSVACNDTTIVVGCSGDNDIAGNSGALYTFDLEGNKLLKIKVDIPISDAKFGDSVAISDNRIVGGAPLDQQIYLFTLDGLQLAKIIPSYTGSWGFGHAVGIANNRITAGQYGYNSNSQGAVYIFNNFRNDLIEIAETVYNKTGVSIKV